MVATAIHSLVTLVLIVLLSLEIRQCNIWYEQLQECKNGSLSTTSTKATSSTPPTISKSTIKEKYLLPNVEGPDTTFARGQLSSDHPKAATPRPNVGQAIVQQQAQGQREDTGIVIFNVNKEVVITESQKEMLQDLIAKHPQLEDLKLDELLSNDLLTTAETQDTGGVAAEELNMPQQPFDQPQIEEQKSEESSENESRLGNPEEEKSHTDPKESHTEPKVPQNDPKESQTDSPIAEDQPQFLNDKESLAQDLVAEND